MLILIVRLVTVRTDLDDGPKTLGEVFDTEIPQDRLSFSLGAKDVFKK